MNEKFRKYLIEAMAICYGILLLFPVVLRSVHADNADDLKFIVNNPYTFTSYINSSYPNRKYRLQWSGPNQPNTFITPQSANPITVYAIRYREYGQTDERVLFITTVTSNYSGNTLRLYYSDDTFTWTMSNYQTFSNSYTATYQDQGGATVNGTTLYYAVNNNKEFYSSKYPYVQLNSGQSVQSILYLFSTDDFSYLPWFGTTSSGGAYFADGTTLDSENTNKYTQIYKVMDIDQDNSVSLAEVNYYNNTYNTAYDYSVFNEDNDFNEEQFLYWVAVQINDGVENPGGGTGDGSGGGSGVGTGGGITVTDSFTQSQNQTIEENAVNVTVNNNNSLSQENVQTLENFIELNLGEQQENAFAEAVGGISRFIGVGQAFAGLVTAVLGFLPAWTITLLGVLFTIIFVMIVFRLLHVFL